MCSSVQRKLSTLSECFSAAVHSADEGLLVCVGTLVFSQILGESKRFCTILARKSFEFAMYVVVSLQGKLGGEALSTVREFALVYLLFLHFLSIEVFNYYTLSLGSFIN